MIVLDTDVVLELMSPTPSPDLLAWVKRTHGVPLHLTAVSFADLNARLETRSSSADQEAAKAAAIRVLSTFRDAILPFDAVAALQYPTVLSDALRIKAPLTLADLQTIAICKANDATLATCRSASFRAAGLPLLDPWQPTKR